MRATAEIGNYRCRENEEAIPTLLAVSVLSVHPSTHPHIQSTVLATRLQAKVASVRCTCIWHNLILLVAYLLVVPHTVRKIHDFEALVEASIDYMCFVLKVFVKILYCLCHILARAPA